MILMPRHFFVYILEQVEAVAGREASSRIYRKAGFDGAVTFCRRFREVHRTSPVETVRGYLEEMSLRGWGHYEIVALDPETPLLEVCLRHSALHTARIEGPRHEVWVGAMEGAVAFMLESRGPPAPLEARELRRAPGDPPDTCRIRVEARKDAS